MEGLCQTPVMDNNLDSTAEGEPRVSAAGEFAAKAHIKSVAEYEAMYRRSVEEPEAFWAEAAGELEWFAPWTKVLDGGRARTRSGLPAAS